MMKKLINLVKLLFNSWNSLQTISLNFQISAQKAAIRLLFVLGRETRPFSLCVVL